MAHELKLFRGHRFLGGRSVAHQVRLVAHDILENDPNALVVLDFAKVEGVSHSFADELLSPLSEYLNEDMKRRVLLANCAPEVLEELQLVADMHRLVMPGAVSSCHRQLRP